MIRCTKRYRKEIKNKMENGIKIRIKLFPNEFQRSFTVSIKCNLKLIHTEGEGINYAQIHHKRSK